MDSSTFGVTPVNLLVASMAAEPPLPTLQALMEVELVPVASIGF